MINIIMNNHLHRLLGMGLNKDEGDQVSIKSEVDYETDIVEELLSD